MFKVGQVVDFKVAKGRGRPMKGEIVKNMGIFMLIRYRGQEVRVPSKAVLREHVKNWTPRYAPRWGTEKVEAARLAA